MTSNAIVWLVINLDRSPERLATMAERMRGLNLAFTRVPAIDGRSLALPLPGIDPDLYRRTHGREILPDEIGCYLSHLRALAQFLASPAPFAVILEDDAIVTSEAVRLVTELTASGARSDFDIVRLEAHHAHAALTVRRLACGTRLCALPFRAAGSAAYLVNRIGAETLLARLFPMRVPYDHAFDRSWDLGLRVRALLPLPIRASLALSTISRAGNTARKRPSQRFRATTRLLRLAAAVASWAAPARALPWPRQAAGPPFATVEAALAMRRDIVTRERLSSVPDDAIAPLEGDPR